MKDRLYTIGEALIDMTPSDVGCSLSEVRSFSPAIGGAPANVAAAFAKLGGRATLLTQLGNDAFGDKIISALADAGVTTDRILRTSDANTALAFVSLKADGARDFSFFRSPSADMLYDGSTLSPSDFADAFALSFCSVSLGDFPMRDAHRRAISLAREAGAIISFDPNLRFPLWKDHDALRATVKEFVCDADVLKISDEELAFITGFTDIHAALPSLFESGAKIVLYSCGADGAYAFAANGVSAYSVAEKVKAIDTTGAGDAFLGAFLFALCKLGISIKNLSQVSEKTLSKALSIATVYSGASVTAHGAIPSYPTIKEIGDRLDV